MFFCAESLVGEAGLVNWNYSLCWRDRRRYDGMLRQQQWQQEMGCHGEHAGTNIALCIIASSDRRPSSTTGNQGLLSVAPKLYFYNNGNSFWLFRLILPLSLFFAHFHCMYLWILLDLNHC